MSRRFSHEPINLIHRIPSPEQLSSARPSDRSWAQMIVVSGKASVRAFAGLFLQVTRWGRMVRTMVGAKTAFQSGLDEHRNEPIAGTLAHLPEGLETSDVVQPKKQAVVARHGEEEVKPPPAAMLDGVQQEEVAKLRAYLLSQQQDIARLSAQIQELKSLVVSQQQVLINFGRELEVSSLSSIAAGGASAAAKRNRPVRQKSGMKDKAGAQQDVPKPSLFNS